MARRGGEGGREKLSVDSDSIGLHDTVGLPWRRLVHILRKDAFSSSKVTLDAKNKANCC